MTGPKTRGTNQSWAAPLSQHLICARHAVRVYGARAVVINLVLNDFDESYKSYTKGPGWWVHAPAPDGTEEIA